MEMEIRYGKGSISLEVPADKLAGVCSPNQKKGLEDIQNRIEKALDHPIGTKRLENLVTPEDKLTLVVDDLTRPVPTKTFLPPIIHRITSEGLPSKNIKIVIALGIHRKLDDEEKTNLVGDIDKEIEVINHDPYNQAKLVKLGKSPYGKHDIWVAKAATQADVKILTGDIELHQLFGYGGGAKSVLPGIADSEAIKKNHSRLLDLGRTIAGKLDNPLRREAEATAQMLGIDFILNVVLNDKKEIVGIFAGDVREAFLEGVKLVDEMYKVQVPKRVDTVVVSCGGYPKDINLYQAQKAIENALQIVKKAGKVILIAECREGWGSDIFYQWIKEASTIKEIVERTKQEFVMGGHKAYIFAKESEWADLFLYSKLESEELAKFITPVSLQEIEKMLKTESGSIEVLPAGSITLPVMES